MLRNAKFVQEFVETTSNMYRLGWDERNAGNISMLVDASEAEPYLDLQKVIRTIPLGFDAKPLAGKYFLATGMGTYFKNMKKDPETNLGFFRVSADGKDAELLWGWVDGGRFTSEIPSHLMSHMSRLSVDPEHRVVLHCHPTYLLAMTCVHECTSKAFTKTLWQMISESIVVFPDGVEVLPWMVFGTEEIGRATAEVIKNSRIVVWPLHGIYGSGRTLDETFGLIEAVEKASQLYILTQPIGRTRILSDDELRALAKRFELTPREGILD